MKGFTIPHSRVAWLAWPASLWVLIRQYAPAVRTLARAEFAIGVHTRAVIRAMLSAVAVTSAVHALTGQTAMVIQVSDSDVRHLTTAGMRTVVTGTVGGQLSVGFVYEGASFTPESYRIDGTVPPGLTVRGADGSTGNPSLAMSTAGVIQGAPTDAGTFQIGIEAFAGPNFTSPPIDDPDPYGYGETTASEPSGRFLLEFNIAQANAPPAFAQQPQSQMVDFGDTATFIVAVTGLPTPTLQWRKDGAALTGQTGATLTITSAQLSDAGTYDCVAANSAGFLTSSGAVLTVNPPGSPTIATPPAAMTVRMGASAFFSVQATGELLGFQWRKDNVDIPGATDPLLLLTNVEPSDAGSYSVVVNNPGGSVTSPEGALTVVPGGSARLVNLSTRAQVGTGEDILIPGFVIADGAKTLLVRAVGPRLGDFGVGGILVDPMMTLHPGQGPPLHSNDDWQQAPGQPEMEAARMSVGAFPLPPSTKDAALLVALEANGYTVQISGVGGTSGVALVELYDSDPSGSQSRLVNISARALVGTGGDILIPGFVIEGNVALSLLVRAVGPTLTDFGVAGVLADPVMTIFREVDDTTSEPVASNDNWEQYPNQPALAVATASNGAFSLSAGGADSAILAAFNPGAYTVQISGQNNTTGIALMELYLVGP